MAVTLKDIAERLGVSVATVSFALRGVNPGRFKLAEATVRRIQETAREMGYRPNRVAASLVQRETHVVGVMIPEAQSDFYGRVFSGISRGLRPDYLPLVALHDSEGRRERQYLNTMIGNRVDAVIAAFSGDPESIPVYRDLLQDYHIPLCLLDRAIPGIDAPVVRPEAARAGAIAVEALAELGHRRVVYGSANDGLDSVLALHEGIGEAASRVGVSLTVVSSEAVHDFRDGTESLGELPERIIATAQATGSSAILVNTDVVAYEILRTCRRRGIRIPHDLSLMGMDDSYPSDLPGVDLSTVRLDLSLIGRRAVETVRALLTGENHVSLTVDLGYELTLRGTTRTYRT